MTYEFSWLLSFLSYYYYYYLCGYLIPLPWGNVDTQYEVQLPMIHRFPFFYPFFFSHSVHSALFTNAGRFLFLLLPQLVVALGL